MPKAKQTKKRASSKKPIIIHIDGVQGSGKSYVCSQIQSSKCICLDIDDIDLEVKNYVDSSSMPKTFNSLGKVWKKRLNEIISKNIKYGKTIIVIVGVKRIYMKETALDTATYKYFIKLDDINTVYRRVFIRETEKILNNGDKIMEILNNKKIEEEELCDLIIRATNSALLYPVDYDRYVDNYKREMAKAKKTNYKIMSQDTIIKTINKLAE